MKRILSVFLVVVMLAAVLIAGLASCDKEPEKEPGGPSCPPITDRRIPLDYLPEDGFGGATFHILAWTANGLTDVGGKWIPWEEGYVAEKDGDMLGSAVFNRNAWVEENYEVTITQEYVSVDPVGGPDYATVVRGDAGSGNSNYQLFTLRSLNIVGLIEEELFADMNDYSQYIKTDQPWWVEDSVASYTLGSHLYVASSEMLLRDKGATAAMYFNQNIAADYDLPDFFTLVEDYEWTLEQMIDACDIVFTSLDGDDEMNSDLDMWGCVGGDSPVYYLFNACGYKFAHIDDDGYVQILRAAADCGLVAVTHAGIDVGYKDKPVHCPPDRALKLIRKVPYSGLVLAHYGAADMPLEVLSTLAGENVYFDTAYILPSIGEDNFKRILDRHGEDRVLFASDSPWTSMKDSIAILRSFGLGKSAEDKILYQNAKRLLGL
jgi:hypothetical protein